MKKKGIKSNAVLIIMSMVMILLTVVSVNAATTATTVVTYPAPEGAPISEDFHVVVTNENIGNIVDLYRDSNSWGNDVSFGYFDFSNGPVDVSITVDDKITFNTYKLVPESLELASSKYGNTIEFTLSSPQKITLILDGNYQGEVLHLFANAMEENQPSPDDPNVIYYGPGYYDLHQTSNDVINLESNQTLYIAGGAFINGRIQVDNVDNVTIRGRGVVSQNYQAAERNQPISIVDSNNVNLQGIILNRRYASWSGLIARCSNVMVEDYKVVSPTYASTDGLNIINSHDITYENCFFHTADDCIGIKGCISNLGYQPNDNPDDGAPNYNITIQNSQFWNDANNCITLGAETQASSYHDINILNNDILYSTNDGPNDKPIDELPERGVFSINSLNGTEFYNITIDRMRIEECNKRLFSLGFEDSFYGGAMVGNQTWPGYINGITFRNITAKGQGEKEIRLSGYSSSKQVSGIKFENVKIDNELIDTLGSPYFNLDGEINNICFTNDDYHNGLDFSTVQGERNWYYKEYNGSTYMDMSWDNSRNTWVGSNEYCTNWANTFMHPDENAAVRSWKAPKDGSVFVRGFVNKWDTTGGDGVRVKIMKNDTQIWPSSGWYDIPYDGAYGVHHGLIIDVTSDDYIYFIVDKNGNKDYDATFWDMGVSYNTVYNAVMDFTNYQMGFNWEYKTKTDNEEYSNMIWDTQRDTWVGLDYFWNNIKYALMHPDVNDTVRVWTAPKSGTIRIHGVVRKIDSNGDGVQVKILKNSDNLWPTSGMQYISGTDKVGVEYDETTVVNAGDKLYFVLNKFNTNAYDSTYWVPNISYQ